MLEIIPAPDGFVAMRASGRLDEADIERGVEAVEAALARHERIALFAEVDVDGISPGALWKDLTYGLGKLGELHRFPRAAIVTDQGWVRRITQAESALLPGIEMRAFPEADREAALSWIAEPLPEQGSEEPQRHDRPCPSSGRRVPMSWPSRSTAASARRTCANSCGSSTMPWPLMTSFASWS